MKKMLNFLLISSLTGTVTSSSTNLFNINNHEVIKTKSDRPNRFLLSESQNLRLVITTLDLGNIFITINASADVRAFAILNALLVENPNLNISEISLRNITSNRAIVAANIGSELYYGNVLLTYTFVTEKRELQNLKFVIITPDLGNIFIPFNASVDIRNFAVLNALRIANPNLSISEISLKYITSNQAIVVANSESEVYFGSLSISYAFVIL